MRPLLVVALSLLCSSVLAQDGPWVDEQDTNGDGVIDWRVRVWSTNGHPTRQEVDEGADGTIDAIAVGTYDAEGAPLSWLVDQDGDGDWEQSSFYTYDAAGRRVHVEADLDGDGATDEERTFDPPCEAPYVGCDIVPSC